MKKYIQLDKISNVHYIDNGCNIFINFYSEIIYGKYIYFEYNNVIYKNIRKSCETKDNYLYYSYKLCAPYGFFNIRNFLGLNIFENEEENTITDMFLNCSTLPI